MFRKLFGILAVTLLLLAAFQGAAYGCLTPKLQVITPDTGLPNQIIEAPLIAISFHRITEVKLTRKKIIVFTHGSLYPSSQADASRRVALNLWQRQPTQEATLYQKNPEALYY